MSGILNDQESMRDVQRTIATGRDQRSVERLLTAYRKRKPFPFRLHRDYNLDGPEGNVHAIIGTVTQVIQQVMKEHDFTREEVKEVTDKFSADCSEREYEDVLVLANSFVSFNWMRDGESLSIVQLPGRMTDEQMSVVEFSREYLSELSSTYNNVSGERGEPSPPEYDWFGYKTDADLFSGIEKSAKANKGLNDGEEFCLVHESDLVRVLDVMYHG